MVTTSQNKYLLYEATNGQFGTPPPAGNLTNQPEYITWSEVEPDKTDDERPTYGQPSVTTIQDADNTSQGLDSAATVLVISVANGVRALTIIAVQLSMFIVKLAMLVVAAILQGVANGIMMSKTRSVTPTATPNSATPTSPNIKIEVNVTVNQ